MGAKSRNFLVAALLLNTTGYERDFHQGNTRLRNVRFQQYVKMCTPGNFQNRHRTFRSRVLPWFSSCDFDPCGKHKSSTHTLEKCFEKTHRAFRSAIENLRLGSINLHLVIIYMCYPMDVQWKCDFLFDAMLESIKSQDEDTSVNIARWYRDEMSVEIKRWYPDDVSVEIKRWGVGRNQKMISRWDAPQTKIWERLKYSVKTLFNHFSYVQLLYLGYLVRIFFDVSKSSFVEHKDVSVEITIWCVFGNHKMSSYHVIFLVATKKLRDFAPTT